MSAPVLLLTLLISPGQTPGEAGLITGTAVNGSAGGTPIAGAEIVLRASRDGSFVPIAETTSDSQGRFAFENLPIERDTIYLPGVSRGGVHYPGPRVRLSRGEWTAQVKLIAFDAVESPSPLVCRRHEITVEPQTGYLEISEALVIDNPSLTAFVGRQDGAMSPVTLRLSLPEGFDKVTFEKEFHGRNFRVLDGVLTTDLPWPPGRRELRFAYRLPADSGNATFRRTLDCSTDEVLLRVAGPGEGRVACNLPVASTGSAEQRFTSDGRRLAEGYQVELRLGKVAIPLESYGRWTAVALLAVLGMGSLIAVRKGWIRRQAEDSTKEHGKRLFREFVGRPRRAAGGRPYSRTSR
jgi:hypothetical protein